MVDMAQQVNKKNYFVLTNGMFAGVVGIMYFPEGLRDFRWYLVAIGISVIGQLIYRSLSE